LVHPSEEHGFKAHFVEEASISVGVTEWIDLPSDPRLDAELLKHPLLAVHHILDHVLVDRTSLIVHGPAGVDDLELAIID
jgi:hypothetical protein